MSEIWRDVPGFEGRYQASNFGRVRSVLRDNKISKPCFHKKGYVYNYLGNGNYGKKYKTHRIVAAAFGLIDLNGGVEINHIDGVKSNNNLSNLEASNRKHNIKHAFKMGLMKRPSGSKCHLSKYTEEQAALVFLMKEYGFKTKDIVSLAGVTRDFVQQVFSGKIWKHVTQFDLPKVKDTIKGLCQ